MAERGSLTEQQNNAIQPTRYGTIIDNIFSRFLGAPFLHAPPCIDPNFYTPPPPPPPPNFEEPSPLLSGDEVAPRSLHLWETL